MINLGRIRSMRDIRGSGRLAGLTWRVAVVACLVLAFGLIGAASAFAAVSTTVSYAAVGGIQTNGTWNFASGQTTITLSASGQAGVAQSFIGIAPIPYPG